MGLPRLAPIAISVILSLCIQAGAVVIRVPGDQPTIQAGIDAASYGDTVLVACGTYYEHDIEMRSGIVLRSETGSPDCVTIDAQQQGRVFYCDGADSQTSVLGLTIVGGFLNGHGAGMYCTSSSPTLTDCTFSGNSGASGGGMSCWDSSLTLVGCTFSGNQTDCWGGGGIACSQQSSATLIDCTFWGNYTYYDGGGVMCEVSSATLAGCTFTENQAFYGGGMMCEASSTTLTGCTFKGNQANSGGGIFCWGYDLTHPTLANCIIAFSTQGGAVACQFEGGISLTCCDIYGNAGGDWVGCIADQYGVSSNFSEDPLFCLDDNPEERYSLHEGSPCLPENSPCGQLVGAFGEGCGPVSVVEATSWGAIKAMYR
jgi:hypothetical protein